MNPNSITDDGLSAGERIAFPVDRYQVTQELSENIILTTADNLYNWARLSSLWP